MKPLPTRATRVGRLAGGVWGVAGVARVAVVAAVALVEFVAFALVALDVAFEFALFAEVAVVALLAPCAVVAFALIAACALVTALALVSASLALAAFPAPAACPCPTAFVPPAPPAADAAPAAECGPCGAGFFWASAIDVGTAQRMLGEAARARNPHRARPRRSRGPAARCVPQRPDSSAGHGVQLACACWGTLQHLHDLAANTTRARRACAPQAANARCHRPLARRRCCGRRNARFLAPHGLATLRRVGL
jgi:hypothetical protein